VQAKENPKISSFVLLRPFVFKALKVEF